MPAQNEEDRWATGNIVAQMIPVGDRLELVPLEVGHAEEMADVLGDPALHAFIGGEPESLEELRARYARWEGGSPDPRTVWCNWVIRAREEGRLVGTVQATVSGGRAEVAWVVGSPWQGRGYATEAARALVGWLREQGVRTVVAHVHPEHAASAAVARAAGLVPTGETHDGEVRWESVGPAAGYGAGSDVLGEVLRCVGGDWEGLAAVRRDAWFDLDVSGKDEDGLGELLSSWFAERERLFVVRPAEGFGSVLTGAQLRGTIGELWRPAADDLVVLAPGARLLLVLDHEERLTVTRL